MSDRYILFIRLFDADMFLHSLFDKTSSRSVPQPYLLNISLQAAIARVSALHNAHNENTRRPAYEKKVRGKHARKSTNDV
jgi:hypothetical protein